MKIIRNRVFETNSSSTHSLVYNDKENYKYLNPSSQLVIQFMNTDDEHMLCTLKEKVSYLVSQIISHYKYDVASYEDLIDEIKNDYDFQRVANYVKEKYNKDIVFPKTYTGDLDDIVLINHQLYWDGDFDDLLEDICSYNHDFLDDILSPTTMIEIGRD